MFDDPSRKWATLLSHSYRPLAGWWLDKCINRMPASPFWNGLSIVKDIFMLGVGKEVNNGRGMRF